MHITSTHSTLTRTCYQFNFRKNKWDKYASELLASLGHCCFSKGPELLWGQDFYLYDKNVRKSQDFTDLSIPLPTATSGWLKIISFTRYLLPLRFSPLDEHRWIGNFWWFSQFLVWPWEIQNPCGYSWRLGLICKVLSMLCSFVFLSKNLWFCESSTS